MPLRLFVRSLSSLALVSLLGLGCLGGPPRDPPADPALGRRRARPRSEALRLARISINSPVGVGSKTTPIPEDQPSWTRSFDVIEESNEVRLRDILERSAKAPAADEPYAKQLGDIYAACMDETAIERADLAPLASELARIDAVHDVPSLSREIAHLHLLGVNVLFDTGAGQDFKDATQMIAIVEQGGLGLPDRDYYLDDDAPKKKIRAAYQSHVAKLFALAGDKPDTVDQQATTVLTIEHALAEASMSKEDRRDPAKTYHRIDRAGLERVMPAFAWGDYLAELGFPNITAVNVEEPGFMGALNRLLGGDAAKPPAPDISPPPGIAPPAGTTAPSAPPIAEGGKPPRAAASRCFNGRLPDLSASASPRRRCAAFAGALRRRGLQLEERAHRRRQDPSAMEALCSRDRRRDGRRSRPPLREGDARRRRQSARARA